MRTLIRRIRKYIRNTPPSLAGRGIKGEGVPSLLDLYGTGDTFLDKKGAPNTKTGA